MLTQSILTEDFYKTSITEAIVSLWDIDFEVAVAPANTKWFIIVNPESSTLREKMFYHNVVWNRIYVKWSNRTNPKLHDEASWIQINDTSDIFNYLSKSLSTTFFVEKSWWLAVTVWWWPVLKENAEVEVLNTNLTMAYSATNYICYNFDTNTISSHETEQGIVVAEVVTSGWIITTIWYRHYKFSINWIKSPYDVAVENWFIGTEADWLLTLRWPAWSIAEANPWEQQQIVDNSIISWATVTTDNSTYILVSYSNWDYTKYLLTNIITWNSNWVVYSSQVVTWSFWTDWITYTTWQFINKVTWDTSFSWAVMYKDQMNNITWVNVFNNTTIFKWQTTFQYHTTTWTTVFDASLWTKQWFNLSDWWAKTFTFTNLLAWNTLVFVVNVTVSPITFTVWTATWPDNAWWTANYTPYKIWDDTYPLSLAVGSHIFIAEIFSTWIHLSYVWISTAI